MTVYISQKQGLVYALRVAVNQRVGVFNSKISAQDANI